jgi:hypothetical protein
MLAGTALSRSARRKSLTSAWRHSTSSTRKTPTFLKQVYNSPGAAEAAAVEAVRSVAAGAVAVVGAELAAAGAVDAGAVVAAAAVVAARLTFMVRVIMGFTFIALAAVSRTNSETATEQSVLC